MPTPARARLFVVASAVFALLAGEAAAQQVAAGADAGASPHGRPSARALELTRRYFAAMHMDRTMHATIRAMAPAVMERMTKANPSITPAQRKAIVEVAGEASQAMVPRLMERLTPIFASTFTEKELEDLVAFYEGPTGQALVAKSPAFSARLGPAVQDLMPTMKADMEARLCARIVCAAKPGGDS